MSKRTPRPPRSRAIVRRPVAPLVSPEVVTGELVQRPDAPPDPLTVYLASLPSPASKSTMRSRLTVAAGILSPGSSAETFRWASLDAASVVRVMDELRADNASPATVNVTRAALRGIARALFGLRMLDAHERQSIDDVKPDRGSRVAKRPALDAKEVRKLFKAAVRDVAGHSPVADTTAARDSALLAVLYGAGLRRDEASHLDVGDYQRGELRVRGKGNKERLAPIGADAAAAVERWIELRGDVKSNDGGRALFLTIDKFGRIGRARLAGAAIFWKVARLAERASIGAASPHALRRSFITAILELGEDLSTAAKAAGHASVTTTARYDRRDGKRVAEAVGRIVVPVGR